MISEKSLRIHHALGAWVEIAIRSESSCAPLFAVSIPSMKASFGPRTCRTLSKTAKKREQPCAPHALRWLPSIRLCKLIEANDLKQFENYSASIVLLTKIRNQDQKHGPTEVLFLDQELQGALDKPVNLPQFIISSSSLLTTVISVSYCRSKK